MTDYFDTHAYYEYLVAHCSGDVPAEGAGRMAGAGQLYAFLDRLDLRPEHAVLEVGCGVGRILDVLEKRHGVAAHGVDPCAEAIEHARRARPDRASRLSHARDGDLSFLPDGAFDRIVFWGVFELTDQSRVAVELARLLRPQGRVLLNSVRNADFLGDDRDMAEAVAAYRDKRIPIHLTDIARFEALARALGFAIDARFVLARKADVPADRFFEDLTASRFAEASYVLTKAAAGPFDRPVALTTWAKGATKGAASA